MQAVLDPRESTVDATDGFVAIRPPETIRSAEVREGIADLRAWREEVTSSWFSLSYERRNWFRACPFLDLRTAMKRLSPLKYAEILLRVLYHIVLRDEAYFNALRQHYQEAGRLAEAIRSKIEEEKFIQARLAEEVFENKSWPECAEAGDNRGRALDMAALRRHTKARRFAF